VELLRIFARLPTPSLAGALPGADPLEAVSGLSGATLVPDAGFGYSQRHAYSPQTHSLSRPDRVVRPDRLQIVLVVSDERRETPPCGSSRRLRRTVWARTLATIAVAIIAPRSSIRA